MGKNHNGKGEVSILQVQTGYVSGFVYAQNANIKRDSYVEERCVFAILVSNRVSFAFWRKWVHIICVLAWKAAIWNKMKKHIRVFLPDKELINSFYR